MKIILVLGLVLIIVGLTKRISANKKIKNEQYSEEEVKKLLKQKVKWTWVLILGLLPFVFMAILLMSIAYSCSNHSYHEPSQEAVLTEYLLYFQNNDSINVCIETDANSQEGFVTFYTKKEDTTDKGFKINTLNTCYQIKKDTLFLYYLNTDTEIVQEIPEKLENIFIKANGLSKERFESIKNDTGFILITDGQKKTE